MARFVKERQAAEDAASHAGCLVLSAIAVVIIQVINRKKGLKGYPFLISRYQYQWEYIMILRF